jgi:AraC-like DNA-binding protein
MARQVQNKSEALKLPFGGLDATLRSPGIEHTHAHHEFVFCIAGSGIQKAADTDHEIGVGDLFLLPAGVSHACVPGSSGKVRLLVLNIEDTALARTIAGDREASRVLEILCERARQGAPRIPLGRASQRRAKRIFQQTVSEYERKQAGFTCAVKLGMQELMLTLLREPALANTLRSADAKAVSEDRLRDVLSYLDTHYFEPVGVAAMAKRSRLSRSHFHAVFREVTGKTLTRHVSELRVQAALKLLRTTSLSILDIGTRVGFNTASHFYAKFTELTGTTPHAWRATPD